MKPSCDATKRRDAKQCWSACCNCAFIKVGRSGRPLTVKGWLCTSLQLDFQLVSWIPQATTCNMCSLMPDLDRVHERMHDHQPSGGQNVTLTVMLTGTFLKWVSGASSLTSRCHAIVSRMLVCAHEQGLASKKRGEACIPVIWAQHCLR